MNCGGCGRENPDDNAFCGGCGAKLASLCSACGRSNPPDNAFCGGCGNALGAPAAAAAVGSSASLSAPPQSITAPSQSSQPAPAATPRLPVSFATGRYDVSGFLGEGSRKRVYLARDARLDRDVAVAQIKTEGLDAGGMERVRREAQAMAKLGDHPHVVTVYDIVEDESDGLLLISQHMSGGDLEARLNAVEDRRLPIAEAVTVADQICSALEHAHSRGVIHRDLKPGNVWLDEDGGAKLGDFGLAVSLDRSRVTQEGMMVGTVAYMAPEQALGRAPDARSDLYSLGAMLYELLTGKPPFLGEDSVAIVSQHINTRPVAPSWHVDAVPKLLEDLTLRLLEKSPDDRPADASEVARQLRTIETAVSSSTHGAPLPTVNPLDRLASGVFVGREQEVNQLREGLDIALAGRGRLAMLVGEPGIGKTRTSEELTTYARMRGSQVLWGRCYEGEGAPPYWPWVQIIRAHVHESDREALRDELGSGASVIAEVVSDIRDAFPDLPTPSQLEGDEARFRLFDGVASFLRNAARRRPIVLVLDDLHWADKSSLLLLQFLARELGRSSIFVLGTYRDVELRRQHPLSAALAELSRGEGFQRVLLRGLQESDVAQFIELSAGTPPQPGLAVSVFRETEGNPFFVHEVVRLLARDGRLDAGGSAESWSFSIPQGVREVIGQRLDQLSEGCNELLRVASAVGREFEGRVLERLVAAPADEVARSIDEALAARVIEPRGKQGRFAYSHALIRETLYEEISTTRRIGLHRKIGEVLEEHYGDARESHLSELAYHFCEAAPGGDVNKAIEFAERAARRAAEQVAHESAVLNFDRALQVIDLLEPSDEHRRLSLLLEFCFSLSLAGEPERLTATSLQAIELARSLGEYDVLAEAVDYWSVPRTMYGVHDAELLERVDEALSLLSVESVALRARLTSRRVVALAFKNELEGAALAGEAYALAQESGDWEARAQALFVSTILHTRPIVQAAREIDEMLTTVPSGGRNGWLLRILSFDVRMTMGEWRQAQEELAVTEAVFERTRGAGLDWFITLCKTSLAMAQGRFEEAEALAQDSFVKGKSTAAENAAQYLAGHLAMLLLYRGRPGELDAAVQGEFSRMADTPLIRASGATFAMAQNQPEVARALVRDFAADDFAKIPAHIDRTYVIALLADVAARLGEREMLPRMYEMLQAEEAVIAKFGIAAGYIAPVSYFLASIDFSLERFDAALEQIATSRSICQRIGLKIGLARTHLLHAQLLEHRGLLGDRAEALERCNAALELANEMGMKLVTDPALVLKLKLQGTDAASTDGTIHVVSDAVQEQRPDIVKHAAPDGTVTLMFSDMEGFTVMTERLGDLRAREVIRDHNRIVREQLARHRGYEVELQGDGFLLAFQSARQALLCAIAIQRAFGDYSASNPDEPIRVRMGLHSGEALRDADKFFGRTVIMAARIAAQANGGEILVSELLKQLTASAGDLRFEDTREVELKGIAEPQRVCQLIWTV